MSCDINKAYPAVLINPMEDFILLSFNDHWQPYDGQPMTLGLHGVTTEDHSLFRGSGI